MLKLNTNEVPYKRYVRYFMLLRVTLTMTCPKRSRVAKYNDKNKKVYLNNLFFTSPVSLGSYATQSLLRLRMNAGPFQVDRRYQWQV